MNTILALLALGIGGAIGLTEPDTPPPSPPEAPAADGARTLFPYLRINTDEKWLELEGFVPIVVTDPDAPLVYLEQVVCGRESAEIPAGKEHESLVATNAKGSHIHAGLLLLGLEPGTPVRWSTEDDGSITSHRASGPVVKVELRWTDEAGEARVQPVQEWIRHAETRERFPEGDWLFSGSLFVTFRGTEVYDADRSGTLIGLTSFGTEVLSWNAPIHHESGIEPPVWTANNDRVPAFKTPVKVRLIVAEQGGEEPAPEPGDSDGSELPD